MIPPRLLTGFEDPEVSLFEFLDKLPTIMSDPSVRLVEGTVDFGQPKFLNQPISLHETEFNFSYRFTDTYDAEKFLNYIIFQDEWPMRVKSFSATRAEQGDSGRETQAGLAHTGQTGFTNSRHGPVFGGQMTAQNLILFIVTLALILGALALGSHYYLQPAIKPVLTRGRAHGAGGFPPSAGEPEYHRRYPGTIEDGRHNPKKPLEKQGVSSNRARWPEIRCFGPVKPPRSSRPRKRHRRAVRLRRKQRRKSR